jgi:UDP-N-acetylglucosamine 2-epimerase (non-hydrolysing)
VGLDGITFSEPFGFLDYNRLQMKSFCVLSDSGSISEESSILRFPAITLRSSIERPEALDTGSIIMTDLRPERVIAGVDATRADHLRTNGPVEYQIADCSIRVRNFILSTAYAHGVWAGLR